MTSSHYGGRSFAIGELSQGQTEQGFVHSVRKAGFPGLKMPLRLILFDKGLSLGKHLCGEQKGSGLPFQRLLLRKLA